MHLKRLVVKNIKGFEDVDLDFTRPDGSFVGWTVLAGRNGSGKSTLLRLIALAVSGPTSAWRLAEDLHGWVRQGCDEGTVEVQIVKSEHDGYSQSGKTGRVTFWAGLKFINEESERALGMSTPLIEPHIAHGREGGKKNAERGPWAKNPKGWFIGGYGPFRRLSGHASDAQRLMLSPHHVGRVATLFREDASLLEAVQWLKEIHTRALENRHGSLDAQNLKDSFIALLDDGLLPDNMRVKRFDSDGLWVHHQGVELPLAELSDGYRTVAALIMDLCRHLYACYGDAGLTTNPNVRAVHHPGVVLIDEVDVHLHVCWQQRIGFWLKQHFPQIQFIVTSHSPFPCQAADPKGLIRLPGPGEQGPPEHVSESTYFSVVNGGADDAVMTALFGMERPDSEQANRLKSDVALLEVKEIRGVISNEEQKELDDKRTQLPTTPDSTVAQQLRKSRG